MNTSPWFNQRQSRLLAACLTLALSVTIAECFVFLSGAMWLLAMRPVVAAVAIAAAIIIPVGILAVIAKRRRAANRRFQFTLRSVMVAVLLLSWPIARVSNEIRKESVRAETQQVAISMLLTLNPKEIGVVGREAVLRVPNPLVQIVASWCLNDIGVNSTMIEVTNVNLSGTSTSDEHLAILAKLDGLESLDLTGTRITDAGLIQLEGLTNLRWLSLKGTGATDEARNQRGKLYGDERLAQLLDLHSAANARELLDCIRFSRLVG